MIRVTAAALAASLALGACTSSSTGSVDPVPSGSATLTASDEPSGDPTATEEPGPVFSPPPAGPRHPGGQAAPTPGPSRLSELEMATPEEFATGLVAVDPQTGTISWYDGLGWSSFDVDAALDALAWATDDLGGVLVQSADRAVWHLEPLSDEPSLVLPSPGTDASIVQRLVGGGFVDGARQALVEQGIVRDPQTAQTDLVGVDIDDGRETVLIPGVGGWEAVVAGASIEGDVAVVALYAEAFGIAFTHDLVTGRETSLVEDEFVSILADADVEDAVVAWALVEDDAGDAELRRSDLDGGVQDSEPLPLHDAPWAQFASLRGRQLATALDGSTIVRLDPADDWRRLEPDVDVPGLITIAPGFALG